MENLDLEVSDPADPNKVADANIFHFHIKFPTFSSNFYYWVKAVKAFFREKSGCSKLSLNKKHPVTTGNVRALIHCIEVFSPLRGTEDRLAPGTLEAPSASKPSPLRRSLDL